MKINPIMIDTIITCAILKAYNCGELNNTVEKQRYTSNAMLLMQNITAHVTCNDCGYIDEKSIFFETCERCGSKALNNNICLTDEQRELVRDTKCLYHGFQIKHAKLFKKLDIKHIGLLTEFFRNKVDLDFVTKVVNDQKVTGGCYNCGATIEFDYYNQTCPNCSTTTVINY